MSLAIISFNINGMKAINKRIGGTGIQGFMGYNHADIYCFQETKLQKDDIDPKISSYFQETKIQKDVITLDSKISGEYKAYYAFCNTKKNYSGVVTYVKNELPCIFEPIDSEFGSEGRIICTDHTLFVLFNVYCPNPGVDDKRIEYQLAFYKLLSRCNDLIKIGRHVVIMGDINTAYGKLDTNNPNSRIARHPSAIKFMDEMFLSFIDSYRHLWPNKREFSAFYNNKELRERGIGWRLDMALISFSLLNKLERSYIMTSNIDSDHCPIVLQIAV